MSSCSIKWCSARRRKNQPALSFHRFPRREVLRRKWLEAIGAENINARHKDPYICSLHFEESQFNKTLDVIRLRDNAVPTLFNKPPGTIHAQVVTGGNSPREIMAPDLEMPSTSNHVPVLSEVNMQVYQPQENLPTTCEKKSPDEMELTEGIVVNVNQTKLEVEHVCGCQKKLELVKEKLDTARKRIRALKARKPAGTEQRSTEPPKGQLCEVLACRACLATDTRLFEMQEHDFDEIFIDLTGQSFSVLDGLPRYLCAFCCAQLSKFAEFREKCQRSRDLLEKLRPIKIDDIKSIDRKSNDLASNFTQTVVHKSDSYDRALCLPQTFKVENENKNDDIFNDIDSLHEPSFFESMTEYEPTNSKQENDNKMEIYTHDTTDNKNEALVVGGTSTKPTKTKSGNTKCRKRKLLFDDLYPNFDYAEFEKSYKVKIELLTIEQQKEEIENKKQKDNYLRSPHRCEMCGKGFNYEVTLKNHMGYHDPVMGPYECEICHFRFRSNGKRLKHRDLHRLRLTCAECGFVSRDRQQARRHFEMHQGKRYKCAHCPLTFARKSSCLNHARILHPSRGVACPTCGETFLSRLGVRYHAARAHRPHTQPTFTCDVCKVTFTSSEALEKHSLSVTEDTHVTHKPCVICGDLFENDEKLATHTKQEHPPDQFRCEECKETFANAASFARHTRRKHRGQRAGPGRRAPRAVRDRAGAGAVCEVCGLMVANESALGYHLYIHMSKKPYACPHCDRTFAAKHSRDWHVLTHTGEKPYQCDICPLSFRIPGNLNRHRNVVHLGQRKSLPCPLCGKIFSGKSVVKLHVDTVHLGKPTPPRRPRKKPHKPAKNTDTDTLD